MCGGTNRPDIGTWDDATLLKAVHAEIKLAMGVTAEPVFSKIVRWPQAIPKYELGHPERVARIAAGAERWRGLFLGGNGYRGIALNDCAEQAEHLAARLQAFAESRTYN